MIDENPAFGDSNNRIENLTKNKWVFRLHKNKEHQTKENKTNQNTKKKMRGAEKIMGKQNEKYKEEKRN